MSGSTLAPGIGVLDSPVWPPRFGEGSEGAAEAEKASKTDAGLIQECGETGCTYVFQLVAGGEADDSEAADANAPRALVGHSFLIKRANLVSSIVSVCTAGHLTILDHVDTIPATPYHENILDEIRSGVIDVSHLAIAEAILELGDALRQPKYAQRVATMARSLSSMDGELLD